MNNRSLKKSFDLYNNLYFDDKLPSTTIVVFGKTTHNADGNYRTKENKIVIHPDLKEHDVLCSICLLHEMGHCKLVHYVGGTMSDDPNHGMIYQAELYRLFMLGAYDGLL